MANTESWVSAPASSLPTNALPSSLRGATMVEGECGTIAGLIKEIASAGEVVRSIIDGVPPILERLRNQGGYS